MDFKSNPLSPEQYMLLHYVYLVRPGTSCIFSSIIHAYRFLLDNKYIEWIDNEQKHRATEKGEQVHNLWKDFYEL